MTHVRPITAGDLVATAAAVAEELFAGAAARDAASPGSTLGAAAPFPHDAFALLHAAELMMAPFPARLGGAGLVEPGAADALCHVLRAVGGGDLSVGRLYEGHVNAVALVGALRHAAPARAPRRGGPRRRHVGRVERGRRAPRDEPATTAAPTAGAGACAAPRSSPPASAR